MLRVHVLFEIVLSFEYTIFRTFFSFDDNLLFFKYKDASMLDKDHIEMYKSIIA